MKIRLSIIWTVFMLLLPISMPAQNMPPLAPDPSVVAGALPNGISYYIVTNPAQAGMADFALVRKGCTDTLSARNELSSLPHFNKSVPYRFLNRKSIGCRPEGFVSFSEGSTIFRFDNVPVYDQAASDTTLLMMFDMIASKPCQHAIVVAGNVTPATILERMKVFSLMVPSRTPEYSKPEYSFTGGNGPEYSLTPSATSTLTVDFRTPRFPDAQMNTIQPFMSRLFCLELAEIVKDRLRMAFMNRNVKAKSFDVEYVGSSQTLGGEHFIVKVSADEDQMVQTTAAVASVLSETSMRGATEGEYLASRDYVYKQMLRPQTNDDLVRMCISNYLTGADLALPATKAAFFTSKTMDSAAERDLFNNFVEALLSKTGNMSVHWTGDEAICDEWTRMTVFSSTWKTVSLLDRPTIRWNVVKKDTVNLWSDRGKTKLKSVSPDAVSGGETWMFANDIKVVYKKDQSLKGKFGYALMVKGGRESLATLDTAAVDCYTGTAVFYKAGAAPTFLRRQGRAMRLEATSLPAGILDGVEPVERRFDLHEEDLILMVSDGVPTEEPWVEEQLAAWEGTDPTELCRRIAEAARLRCRDPRPDDITVAALRLEKAE